MSTESSAALKHLKRTAHSVGARSEMIANTRWTDGLHHNQRLILAQYMESFEIEEGETILSEGGRDAHMLLVTDGKVDIVKNDGRGSSKVVATIGPGRTFGEMSLFDGEPRSASAVAASRVKFLILSRDSFERLTVSYPPLAIAIYAKLTKLLSQRLRQTTGRLVELL